MAKPFAGEVTPPFDYTQLQSLLVNSRLQKTNPALYRVVNRIIFGAKDWQNGIDGARPIDVPIDLTDVSGELAPINGGVAAGFYFPTFTSLANINTFSVYYSHVLIMKRLIRVDGKLNIKPTAANVLTEAELQLPIHSNFAGSDQLQGIINGIPLDGSTEGFPGIITGDVATGAANIRFYPRNIDNHDCRFSISYELV